MSQYASQFACSTYIVASGVSFHLHKVPVILCIASPTPPYQSPPPPTGQIKCEFGKARGKNNSNFSGISSRLFEQLCDINQTFATKALELNSLLKQM